jgi:transposase
MFIRETHKVDKKSGVKYTSQQLVESFRTPKGPRQRILCTVKTDTELSDQERKSLANRIEELIIGYNSYKRPIDVPQDIETLAQHFSQLVLQDRATKIERVSHAEVSKEETDQAQEPDYQPVNLNNIQTETSRSIGAEHVAYSAYCDLGIHHLFNDLGFSKKQQNLAAASIIARAIAPASERATHRWLQTSSGLGELLGDGFGTLNLNDLYSISDKILFHKKRIEQHLVDKERNLFKLEESIILYDITNTYFEGNCNGHSKAHRGKSKEMRSDCPLLSLGVVLDGQGFPKHSEIFEGNVNERATLQTMISRLDRGGFTKRPIIVMDAGIATKENADWLKSNGYAYIIMMKGKYRPLREEAAEITIKDDGHQFVSVSLVNDKESGDNLLYCYSKQRHNKEKDIKDTKVASFEKCLNDLRNGLTQPRKMKKTDKVKEKIGRLRQQYSRVSQHYQITVHTGQNLDIATDITWVQDSKELERSYSGTYSLRTNVTDLAPQNLWRIYMMLAEAESCYRCLKSEAGLRPNYHRMEGRIDGHIFISLLAYHLIATIQMRLKQQSIFLSWDMIRKQMLTQVLVTSVLQHKNGHITRVRTASNPEEFHKKIYHALRLSTKPCGYRKTIFEPPKM